MLGFVRDKASICPYTSDDVVMHIVVKADAFEFIGRGCMKNWIVLRDLHKE